MRQLEVQGHGDNRVLHCTHCLETIRPFSSELKPGRMTDCARRHFNSNCIKAAPVCAAVDSTLLVEKHCVCRGEYNKRQGIMFRCRLCFVWHHPKCIQLEGPDLAGVRNSKHPERFVCPGWDPWQECVLLAREAAAATKHVDKRGIEWHIQKFDISTWTADIVRISTNHARLSRRKPIPKACQTSPCWQ